jgi:hypothetical protein
MSADDEKERGFSVKGNNRPGLDRRHGYGSCSTERENKPSCGYQRHELIVKGIYEIARNAKASREEMLKGLDDAEKRLTETMRKANRD